MRGWRFSIYALATQRSWRSPRMRLVLAAGAALLALTAAALAWRTLAELQPSPAALAFTQSARDGIAVGSATGADADWRGVQVDRKSVV